MTDNDISDLRERTSSGDRMDHAAQADTSLVDDLVAALDALEDGDRQPNVTVRDPSIVALLDILDDDVDDDRRRILVEDLASAAGMDVDGAPSDSDLVRMLLRAGLEYADPDLREQLGDAVAERARRNA